MSLYYDISVLRVYQICLDIYRKRLNLYINPVIHRGSTKLFSHVSDISYLFYHLRACIYQSFILYLKAKLYFSGLGYLNGYLLILDIFTNLTGIDIIGYLVTGCVSFFSSICQGNIG